MILIPDKLNSSEFQDLIKKGVIDTSGKRLMTSKLSSNYEKMLEDDFMMPPIVPKTGNLFKDNTEYKKAEIMEPKSYNEVLEKLRILHKDKKAIFIPYSCPSSKNSKEIVRQPTKLSECCKGGLYKVGEVWTCTNCHRPAQRKYIPRLVMSKLCMEYIKNTKKYWIENRELFHSWIKDRPKPYFIGIYAIRETAHKFDFINMCQILCDIMIYNKEGEENAEWLIDDNCDEIITVFLGYHKCQENPGVILTLLDHNLYYQLLNNCL